MSVVGIETSEIRHKLTADDLAALPNDRDFELVHGELVERAMGNESVFIAGQLFGLIMIHVKQHKLGWPFMDGAAYILTINGEESVRKPDVSFVSFQRLPPQPEVPRGYYRLAPDLAVEVTSPNDLSDEVDQKIEDYLVAGVRQVWLVHPPSRTVAIYRTDGTSARLREPDTLDGEDVLPGFRCAVAELFAVPQPA